VNQIAIEPDPARLAGAGLSFDDIATVVRENVSNSGGGVVQRGGQQVLVRAISRVQTVEEIQNLAIRYGGSAHPILIREVAEVKEVPAPRNGAALVNGEEAVIASVIMLRGENTRAVAQRVNDKLKEVRDRLPQGLELIPLYDRSTLISSTVGTIKHNMFAGAILVAAVLFAFLGNWRSALIVALAIPLSLLIALTGMVQFRITGNLISLGAIDFGLLVDGSVVMVENILRHISLKQIALGRSLTQPERLACIEEASAEVAPSMVFGVGIITLVYVPIFALTGVEGKMFEPLAATVTMALAGALVLALTLIPSLCVMALSGRVHEGDNVLVRFVKTIYKRILRFAVPRHAMLSVFAVILFAVSLFVFSQLGSEYIPHLDEGSTLLAVSRADSINLESSLNFQRTTEQLIRQHFPQVSMTFSRVGSDDKSVDPVGVNQSDTYLLYDPAQRQSIHKYELENEMSDALQTAVPGQNVDFVQPIEDRFNDFLQGARADISVKIYGDDFAVLEKLGNQVQDVLTHVSGSADVTFNGFQKTPIEEIQPNRNALALYGLQADDINHALTAAMAGEKLGSVQNGDRLTDIVLRYPNRVRVNADQLDRFQVRMGDGGMIPLGKLAAVHFGDSVSEIKREEGRRLADVAANVRGRDVGSFVQELRTKLNSEVKVPDGYRLDLLGQFKNLESASARLRLIVPTVLLAIFALIYAAFRDLRQVCLVYTGIPLATTGGIFSLWLRHLPFSLPAAIGFIALTGIAVLNGIVLISYFNRLRNEGKPILQAVEEGSLTRLRPVLMTALVASFGLIPMAIATGPGAEVQRPLATVVIGGVLTSTFLTLLLLPSLYARYAKK
jgi:cobalt-zinc-cadmium resistance protein CzcA